MRWIWLIAMCSSFMIAACSCEGDERPADGGNGEDMGSAARGSDGASGRTGDAGESGAGGMSGSGGRDAADVDSGGMTGSGPDGGSTDGAAGEPAVDNPCLMGGKTYAQLTERAQWLSGGVVTGVAVGDDAVFWSELSTGIMRLSNGAIDPDSVVLPMNFAFEGLWLTAERVVWYEWNPSADVGLYRVQRDVVEGFPNYIGMPAMRREDLGASAITNERFYYDHIPSSSLMSMSLDDGSTELVHEGRAGGIHVHDGYVYFSSTGDSKLSISRIAAGSTAVERVTQEVASTGLTFVVDDEAVYWSASGDGEIYRTPLGEPDTIDLLAQVPPGRLGEGAATLRLDGDRVIWHSNDFLGFVATDGTACGTLVREFPFILRVWEIRGPLIYFFELIDFDGVFFSESLE